MNGAILYSFQLDDTVSLQDRLGLKSACMNPRKVSVCLSLSYREGAVSQSVFNQIKVWNATLLGIFLGVSLSAWIYINGQNTLSRSSDDIYNPSLREYISWNCGWLAVVMRGHYCCLVNNNNNNELSQVAWINHIHLIPFFRDYSAWGRWGRWWW